MGRTRRAEGGRAGAPSAQSCRHSSTTTGLGHERSEIRLSASAQITGPHTVPTYETQHIPYGKIHH
ncbi:hypothetical protein HMPREF1550_02479 [Actinomyces sp. oral taxon 877 str. F0543]|nr:hypothetical protein HMPREF1550_02479 [Actinomyces sp. oral taxon 877 str. F0543]